MSSTGRKPQVSLRGLRTFCVAARFESFSLAADALFVTASAVSHQIKNLEDELKEQLFDRNSRELKLTPIGRAMYEEVNPLIEDLDVIVGKYRKGGISTTIRISVQPFFASEFFIPRLTEFTTRHPNIDIKVGTSDESAEKHPADADLSIRLFKKPPADLQSHLLFPLRLLPAGSREFKKNLKTKGKQIVSDFPIIVHETYPKAWKQWAKRSGYTLPEDSKATRLDSMIAVVRAAQKGIGAALLPVPVGNQWFEEGSVVPLFPEELVADVSYFLVAQEEKPANPSIRVFRDWILETFAEKD